MLSMSLSRSAFHKDAFETKFIIHINFWKCLGQDALLTERLYNPISWGCVGVCGVNVSVIGKAKF